MACRRCMGITGISGAKDSSKPSLPNKPAASSMPHRCTNDQSGDCVDQHLHGILVLGSSKNGPEHTSAV
eukprot:1495097-Amphidinium_carterae.1